MVWYLWLVLRGTIEFLTLGWRLYLLWCLYAPAHSSGVAVFPCIGFSSLTLRTLYYDVWIPFKQIIKLKSMLIRCTGVESYLVWCSECDSSTRVSEFLIFWWFNNVGVLVYLRLLLWMPYSYLPALFTPHLRSLYILALF